MSDYIPPSPHPAADGTSLKSIMFAVAAGQFFLPFMMGGVMTILPAIGTDLGASAMELSLIGGVYTLSLSIFHLVSGRVGDMYGRRRLFLFGFALLITGMFCMTIVPSMRLLLVLRFMQAAGVGIMNTTSLAILISCTPYSSRGRVLAITSMGLTLGISCGPPVAGLVSDIFGWRWLFGLLAPLAIPSWLLMAFLVRGEWYEAREEPFDWKGSLCFAIGLSAVAIGAAWQAQAEWALWLMLFGILGLCLFVYIELKVKRPILDVRFLAGNANFALSLLTAFINFGSIFGGIFYFSLYLQYVHRLSMRQASLFLVVQPVLQIIVAPFAGRLADRYGPERIASFGIALCGLSLLLAGQLIGHGSPLWQVVVVLGVMGMGMGFFASPNVSAIFGSVDAAHTSQASGMSGTVRTLGMLANMTLVSMTLGYYLGDAMVGPDNVHLFLQAMNKNFLQLGFVNLFALGCSLYRLWMNRART